jgi:hypothetical protein
MDGTDVPAANAAADALEEAGANPVPISAQLEMFCPPYNPT